MIKMWLLSCLVFTVVCFDGARSELPPPSAANVGFYFTAKGADYANDFMVNKTTSTIEGQKVPPVSIRRSIFWNIIRLSLTKSKIRSVSLGSTSIQFQKGHVKVVIKINSAEVAGDYNYHGGILGSGKGTYTVSLKNVWINKFISIGVNAEGKPVLINGRCSNWIEDTSTDFTGGASFIINLLVALVKSSVDNDVRKKICTSINEAVAQRKDELTKYYPGSYNVSRVQCAQIDFPLLQKPVILESHIEFLVEGGINTTCYQLNNSSRERGVHQIRFTPNPPKMLSVVLSDRFINSLADLYYKAGLMNLMDFQSKDPLLDPIQVTLHLTSPPRINTTLNTSLVVFKMKTNLTTTSSVDETSQTFPVDLEIIGDFYMEEEARNFSGKVKNLRFEPVFPIDTPENIKSLVLPVLQAHDTEIVNRLNGFFGKLALLPVAPYIHFTNKHFLRKEGYTVFESDIKM